MEEKIKALEGKENSVERLNKLKSLGVFIKTYNMAHLLVTRYSVKEDFGIAKSLEKLEKVRGSKIKEKVSLGLIYGDKYYQEMLSNKNNTDNDDDVILID